jgi:Zn-dependent protease with chaperone function
MAKRTIPAERITFPGLKSTAFEHPMDRTALEALRKTPGLDKLMKKLASLHFERIVRIHYTADSLRLTPKQCPRQYALLQEACRILDMPEPDLYLMQTPHVNAFAIGMERHTIVITSGLVDLMDDDELRCVIGHELGHIKSGHMLYRTMAIFISMVGLVAARNLPLVNLLSQAMMYAFYDWSRKSELTSDRAGMLVTQDPDVSIRTLLKLAGGTLRTNEGLNVEEFLRQAEDFEDMGANLLDMFYQVNMTIEQTHPFPALRAREVQRWSETNDYQRIMAGDYPHTETAGDERRCPRCAASVDNPIFKFCPECGATL